MAQTPRPYGNEPGDPLLRAAEEVAQEIVRDVAARAPWQARDTADAVMRALDGMRRARPAPPPGSNDAGQTRA